MEMLIYQGEGHRWRSCQYLGQRCHYCAEKGQFKRECTHKISGQTY